MTKNLVKTIPNFPEAEKEEFLKPLTDREIDLISYKGLVFDAQNECYCVLRISEEKEKERDQALDKHFRPSRYTASNTIEQSIASLSTKTTSIESNSSSSSSSNLSSSSLSEDFEISDSTTCKVIKLIKSFKEKDITQDENEILKIYKHDRDFLFFKRLVNRSTIKKNWHPKEKMMFCVVENNFEFGVFAAHLKLLGLYHEGKLELKELATGDNNGTKAQFKDLAPIFYNAIESTFGSSDGLYNKKMYGNPDDYLVKNDTATLEVLKSLTTTSDQMTKDPKYIFLATNSPPQYAKFLLNYCIGPEWYQNFSLVLFRCKKPNFFTLSNPFQSLNRDSFQPIKNTTELTLRTNKTLNDGYFTGGSYKPVNEVFMKQFANTNSASNSSSNTSPNEPKILYFGDSVVSDIVGGCWDSCYVKTDLETPEWAEKIVKEGESDKIKNYHLIEYVVKNYANMSCRTIDDVQVQ